MNLTKEAREMLEGEATYRHVTDPNGAGMKPITAEWCLQMAAGCARAGHKDQARVCMEAAKLIMEGRE